MAGALDRLTEEPAVYVRILRGLGCQMRECRSAEQAEAQTPWLADCAVIVDAVLGIGVRGPVREPAASVIRAINRMRKPVVSADVPSGLDGDTGQVQGEAVRAQVTVAFGLPKHGCLQADGPAHAGQLLVDPITIPRALLTP